MPAFEGAVALGFPYLETDAHVTADGVCLAFHDDHLDRVTDRSGAIATLPYRTVKDARVDGREPIPLLEDLIASFPGVRINIDPKHDAVIEALAAVIRRTASLHRVCLGSFSDDRLVRLRHMLGPELCTSLGPRGVARLRAGSFGLPTGELAGACVQVPHKVKGVRLVDERFVARAHGAGLQVHVWTVDDPAEMHELLDRGVDGLMTDQPSALKTVLESRGAWYPTPSPRPG